MILSFNVKRLVDTASIIFPTASNIDIVLKLLHFTQLEYPGQEVVSSEYELQSIPTQTYAEPGLDMYIGDGVSDDKRFYLKGLQVFIGNLLWLQPETCCGYNNFGAAHIGDTADTDVYDFPASIPLIADEGEL